MMGVMAIVLLALIYAFLCWKKAERGIGRMVLGTVLLAAVAVCAAVAVSA
jgi:hypothetical protein